VSPRWLLVLALAGCSSENGIELDVVIDVPCTTNIAAASIVQVQIATEPHHLGDSSAFDAQTFFHNEHEVVFLFPDTETSAALDVYLVNAQSQIIERNSFRYTFSGPGYYKEPGTFPTGCGPAGDGPITDGGMGDGSAPDGGAPDGSSTDGSGMDGSLGRTWNPVAINMNFDLYAVYGASPNDWHVVGGQSTSLAGSQGGLMWVPDSVALGNVYSVWGDGNGHVWEIGDMGQIYYKDGNNPFVAIATCGSGPLFGVAGDGNGDVWVGGTGGTLCHASDGVSFNAAMPPGIFDINYGFNLSGKHYLFATDGGQRLEIMNGSSTMTPVKAANGLGLEAASGDDQHFYLVGAAGTLLTSTNLTDWTQHNETMEDLHGVWARGSSAYVVGENSTLLHSEDAGGTWTHEAVSNAMAYSLQGVWSVGGTTIAVGHNGIILRRN
jgi:hypothetical protein